jgi:dihydroflavonol-4-reductase
MILITGAAGHIGNVITRKLVEQGHHVRALVLPGEDISSLADSKPEIVEGNILDYPSLLKAMQGVRFVYHLASLVAIVPEQYAMMRKVNVEGTANVIRACKEAGVKRLIYTSSIHAYGHPDHNLVIDETLPFDTDRGKESYDQTKAEASVLVQNAADDDLETILLMPTGIIGPYDYKRSEMGEVTLYWMKNGPTASIDGAFDFADVRDVADAHISALSKGRSGEAYLLGGHQISIRDYRKVVQKAAGVKGCEVYFPYKLAYAFTPLAERVYRLLKKRPAFTRYALKTLMSNSVISSKKAIEELNYKIRSLEETVRDSVNWWKENQARILPSLRNIVKSQTLS